MHIVLTASVLVVGKLGRGEKIIIWSQIQVNYTVLPYINEFGVLIYGEITNDVFDAAGRMDLRRGSSQCCLAANLLINQIKLILSLPCAIHDMFSAMGLLDQPVALRLDVL